MLPTDPLRRAVRKGGRSEKVSEGLVANVIAADRPRVGSAAADRDEKKILLGQKSNACANARGSSGWPSGSGQGGVG